MTMAQRNDCNDEYRLGNIKIKKEDDDESCDKCRNAQSIIDKWIIGVTASVKSDLDDNQNGDDSVAVKEAQAWRDDDGVGSSTINSCQCRPASSSRWHEVESQRDRTVDHHQQQQQRHQQQQIDRSSDDGLADICPRKFTSNTRSQRRTQSYSSFVVSSKVLHQRRIHVPGYFSALQLLFLVVLLPTFQPTSAFLTSFGKPYAREAIRSTTSKMISNPTTVCPFDQHRLRILTLSGLNSRPSLLLLSTTSSSSIPSSSPSSPPHTGESSTTTTVRISDRNVELNTTQPLVYDPNQDRFVRDLTLSPYYSITQYSAREFTSKTRNKLRLIIQQAFLPQGVNDSYFQFMKWRILQRFVNSNLHVLGTQSLLMGLGLKSKSLGVSAALTWVLKDALGKLTRLVWASRMGRRFDSDAKRWRFRASLVYALGNYLEIVTYINPALFLLWATLANSCKQVAMLTSSATRTALYNSFRDGKRENIADITAKGEAQIAVVDLLGIAFGVSLSKAVGTSIKSVLTTYIILQVLELNLLFREIRSVRFNVMNFERMAQVIESFLHKYNMQKNATTTTTTTTGTNSGTTVNGQSDSKTAFIPSPEDIAMTERIFLPPKHLRRRALAFGSIGRAKLNPDELSQLLDIFAKDRYILIVGENTKKNHRKLGLFQTTTVEEAIQQNCHIVLHEDATNLDILKSTLGVFILRRKLVESGRGVISPNEDEDDLKDNYVTDLRSSDCYDLLEQTRDETDQLFPLLIRQLSQQGWAPPSRFMFGRVQQRAYWPLTTGSK